MSPEDPISGDIAKPRDTPPPVPGQELLRFSTRAGSYIRGRPRYPAALLDWLREDFAFSPAQVVADIGSGTGILTELLLRHGNPVFAVEPNVAMRSLAEHQFGQDPKFTSVAGKAESTILPDASVDWIAAAQAFHWFDPHACGREWRRILRAGGRVLLVWNDRRTDTPVMAAYEAFIHRFERGFGDIRHRGEGCDRPVRAFFGPGLLAARKLDNRRALSFEELLALVLSSSYMPTCDDPRYEEMQRDLKRLFEAHAGGENSARGDDPARTVEFEYDTRAYVGCLT